jgi:heat shock protein HslJ
MMGMLRAMIAVGLLALTGCGWMTSSTPEHPLERTWQLEELDGRPVLKNLPPTLTFAGDGTVSGSGGCNTFHGTVTLSGNSIHFGPLAMTRRGCMDVVMDQEQRYVQALDHVTTWRIVDRDVLVIDREGGATPMRFTGR